MAYSASPIQLGEKRELSLGTVRLATDDICQQELLRKSSDPPPFDAVACVVAALAAARAQVTQNAPLAVQINQLVINSQAVGTQSMLDIVSQAPPSGIVKLHGKTIIVGINAVDQAIIYAMLGDGRLLRYITEIKSYALRYGIPMVALRTDMPFTGPSVYIQSSTYDPNCATIDPKLDKQIYCPEVIGSDLYVELPDWIQQLYRPEVDWSKGMRNPVLRYRRPLGSHELPQHPNNYIVESLANRNSWYAMGTVGTQLTSLASAKSVILPVIENVSSFGQITALSILYTIVTLNVMESISDVEAFIFEAYNILITPKYLASPASDELQDPTRRARSVNPSLPQNLQPQQQRYSQVYQPSDEPAQTYDVTEFRTGQNVQRTQNYPAPNRPIRPTQPRQGRGGRGRSARGAYKITSVRFLSALVSILTNF